MLFELFLVFMRIGLGAYGGGLVTIPLIQHELVASRQWLSFDEMARIIAIAQMTPGPIAINAATFTGFRLGGVAAAVTATASVVLPSILIFVFLVPLLDRVKKIGYARRFRLGIQIGVLSLILFAVWSYGAAAVQGWADFIIAAGAFLSLFVFEGKIHPILVILFCGLIGAAVF